MLIERKQISSNECMLFLSEPLPVLGTFFVNKTTQTSIELLQNIYATQLADTILLTSDFLYIKSNTNDNLSDLEIISLAEIDDFSLKSNQLNDTISKEQIVGAILIVSCNQLVQGIFRPDRHAGEIET
mgnify:CR=1 FL=1